MTIIKTKLPKNLHFKAYFGILFGIKCIRKNQAKHVNTHCRNAGAPTIKLFNLGKKMKSFSKNISFSSFVFVIFVFFWTFVFVSSGKKDFRFRETEFSFSPTPGLDLDLDFWMLISILLINTCLHTSTLVNKIHFKKSKGYQQHSFLCSLFHSQKGTTAFFGRSRLHYFPASYVFHFLSVQKSNNIFGRRRRGKTRRTCLFWRFLLLSKI